MKKKNVNYYEDAAIVPSAEQYMTVLLVHAHYSQSIVADLLHTISII